MVQFQPLRVLHIMSSYGGGISSFIYNQARGLQDPELIFDVMTYSQCPPDFEAAIAATGGRVYQLKNPKQAGLPAFLRSFDQAFQGPEYDRIHCHIQGYRALVYWLACRRHYKGPFYIHAHQSFTPKQEPWFRLALRANQWLNRQLTDAYIACGEKALQGVFGPGLDIKQGVVIPNSIDPERFVLSPEEFHAKRFAMRAQWGIGQDEWVIGHIARFEPAKNHAFVLDLAQAMKELKVNAKILLVGSGTLVHKVQEQIQARHLDPWVTWLGRVSPIEDFYPGLDLLLLPSHYEGLPTVVVEAQAAGIPSLLADTITKEVDLGLGLVDYQSLEAPLTGWIEKIQSQIATETPPAHVRLGEIQAQSFTNQGSSRVYVDFLRGQITSHLLD